MGISSLRKNLAVFLDRDGVLNEAIIKKGLPYPPSSLIELTIMEETISALKKLKLAGFLLIVVTNQPDVARGTQTKNVVEEINMELKNKLQIDDFIVCYHDDVDNCNCRKPKPGMLLDGAVKHDINIDQSYMIGDRWRDIEAGFAAGCTTIHIYKNYNEKSSLLPANYSVSSLSEAVEIILGK